MVTGDHRVSTERCSGEIGLIVTLIIFGTVLMIFASNLPESYIRKGDHIGMQVTSLAGGGDYLLLVVSGDQWITLRGIHLVALR